jgi:transcription elongation factor GreA
LFGEKVPAGAEANGLDANTAKAIASAAAKIILNIIPSDLTALNEAITSANQKNESLYTPNSWVALEQALASAKLLNDESAQKDVDLAAEALNKALQELVERADFTALNKAIDEARSKVKANYTDASWADLEAMLKNAQVIDDMDIVEGTITIGCTVKLYDVEFEEELLYTIVGSAESDPEEFKISDESPVGAALIGHVAGDEVTVTCEAGHLKFKILEVQR